MEVPEHIVEKLLRLMSGERIPASSLHHPLIQELYNEEVIQKQVKGRSKVLYYIDNPQYLEAYIRNNHGINHLTKYLETLKDKSATRADAVETASNSKLTKKRTLEGFFVTSYEPIETKLFNNTLTINPPFGTSVFVNEYRNFNLFPDTTIVGIENAENFKYVEKQKYLFQDKKVLFVFKHPQSNDLIKWLETIPNEYLHFGDFDFCALTIYYSQYKKRLQAKCNLFMPPDLESYIKDNGNKHLYNDQLRFEPKGDALNEKLIQEIVALIHKYRKGLEQEIFINNPMQKK
jgi:hypothetical protein